MPPVVLWVMDDAPTPAPSPGTPPFEIEEPFYTGIAGTSSGGGLAGGALPVTIGSHTYAVDWKQYQRSTVSPFREARDSSALPGEQTLNPLGAWKRSRDDWTLGGGQTWSDRQLDQFATVERRLEPRQFDTSKGVDVWTLGQFKLLPDTELARADTGSGQMLSVGGFIYVLTTASSGSVYRTANPDALPPTVVTITGLTGTPLAMATDGVRIFISTTTGMFTALISGTVATAMPGAAATYKPTVLQWTNGWLYGALNNVISEIRSDGTVNTVFTHLNAGFVFNVICGTPSFTYFGGQGTDINEIYRVGVKNDGTLMAAIFSGSLPIGEFVRAMSYYAGYILVGTTKGVHLAAQAGDGTINMAPVIKTPQPVLCTIPESKYVWFGWTAFDASSTGLGRMDLSTFTDVSNLVSSFASDLMYPGSANVTSVVRFNNKTYFFINGVGIIRERWVAGKIRYVASGNLHLGRFRWGTFEPKVWLGIEVVSEALAGLNDGTITMSVINDAMVEEPLGARGPGNGTTGLGSVYGIGTITRASDWFEPVVTLTPRGANLEDSPIVRRVTIRALPVPKVVEQFQLPLRMAEDVQVEMQEGGDYPYKTSAEYQYLSGLVQQGIPVAFAIHGEQHLVTVREVAWGDVVGLTSLRDGVQGHLMVTLVTAEL